MKTSGIKMMMGDFSMGQSQKTDKSSSSDVGFDSIMNLSLTNQSKAVSENNSYDDTLSADKSTTSKVEDKQIKVNDSHDETVKSDGNVDNKKDIDKTTEDVSDKSKEFEDSVRELEKQIKKVLKDILGLSDEELENLLTQTGLVPLALLDVENLKEFVVVVSGENDISAILTNEDVLNTFNMITEALNDIPVEDITGMETEQFNQLVKDTLAMMEDNTIVVENAIVAEKSAVEDNVDTNIVDADEGLVETKADKSVKKEVVIEIDKEVADSTSDEKLNNNSFGTSQDKDANAQAELKAYNTFVENLATSVDNTIVQDDFAGAVSVVKQMQEIVNQIVERVKINISSESTDMQIMLNPEHLGRLNLSVSAKNGVMTAQFIVENEVAKHAIESQIQILKDNLENQGVKVEAVEVTVSNMQDFTRNPDSNSERDNSAKSNTKKSRSINLSLGHDDDTLSEEDKVIADMMRKSGSLVDFTA